MALQPIGVQASQEFRNRFIYFSYRCGVIIGLDKELLYEIRTGSRLGVVEVIKSLPIRVKVVAAAVKGFGLD